MKSQVLYTMWCHISCEAAWSLSGVKGLNLSKLPYHTGSEMGYIFSESKLITLSQLLGNLSAGWASLWIWWRWRLCVAQRVGETSQTLSMSTLLGSREKSSHNLFTSSLCPLALWSRQPFGSQAVSQRHLGRLPQPPSRRTSWVDVTCHRPPSQKHNPKSLCGTDFRPSSQLVLANANPSNTFDATRRAWLCGRVLTQVYQETKFIGVKWIEWNWVHDS